MLKRVVHPGEILKDELAEFGVTPTSFARQIKVPPNRISQIISGKRSVTGDTALRFGHWFGVDPQFWLNLQTQFDLAVTDQRIGAVVRELPIAPGTHVMRPIDAGVHPDEA
jgi:addiction module HigA family antidote